MGRKEPQDLDLSPDVVCCHGQLGLRKETGQKSTDAGATVKPRSMCVA